MLHSPPLPEATCLLTKIGKTKPFGAMQLTCIRTNICQFNCAEINLINGLWLRKACVFYLLTKDCEQVKYIILMKYPMNPSSVCRAVSHHAGIIRLQVQKKPFSSIMGFFYWELSLGRKQQGFYLLCISAPMLLQTTLTAPSYLVQAGQNLRGSPAFNFPLPCRQGSQGPWQHVHLEAGIQAPQCYARGWVLNLFFVPISYLQTYNTDMQLLFCSLHLLLVNGIFKSSDMMLVLNGPGPPLRGIRYLWQLC